MLEQRAPLDLTGQFEHGAQEHLRARGASGQVKLQQIIVITGLHHILNAAEAQLIATTGRNFLNPLMSVALISQGGAVIGYYLLHRKDKKLAEIALPSFVSILFGISEPAIFGVNLKYRFPLIAGCIAGAIAGAFVYLFNLTSLGFGATAIPGLSIIDPVNNGYLNYVAWAAWLGAF